MQYLWKRVKILQMLYLGVNYCLSVTFVDDSRGYLRNDREEKMVKKKKREQCRMLIYLLQS